MKSKGDLRDLERQADILLKPFCSSKLNSSKGRILSQAQVDRRVRKEVYNSRGVPDSHIISGLYNRSHPQGRALKEVTASGRKQGFYKV